MTKDYIGTKHVTAKPMNLGDYNNYRGWTILENEDPTLEGYLVKYSSSYESWSPKEEFEKAYLPIGNENKITLDVVKDFINMVEVSKIGDKTTVVRAILVNGFEIIETSSCVDPKNYDEALGEKYALEKIYSKVFCLLGFLLQTANNGIKN